MAGHETLARPYRTAVEAAGSPVFQPHDPSRVSFHPISSSSFICCGAYAGWLANSRLTADHSSHSLTMHGFVQRKESPGRACMHACIFCGVPCMRQAAGGQMTLRAHLGEPLDLPVEPSLLYAWHFKRAALRRSLGRATAAHRPQRHSPRGWSAGG
jgi:hypothetical protein